MQFLSVKACMQATHGSHNIIINNYAFIQVAGYVTKYDMNDFTFLTVKGSGHMVSSCSCHACRACVHDSHVGTCMCIQLLICQLHCRIN